MGGPRPALAAGTPDSAVPRLRWLFTGRAGGVSSGPFASRNLAVHVGDDPGNVTANRQGLAGGAGVDAGHAVFIRAAHGRQIATIDGPRADDVPGVDGLATAIPGLALTVLAADCVPVLLADPRAGVIAAVHAGWRGVALDVAGAAVAAMCDLGARPHQISAWLGPAICGACYSVDLARFREVSAVAPGAAAGGPGRPALDLRAGIAGALRGRGVRVTSSRECTAESDDYFSYRRDGQTGRQAGVIVLGAGQC